jgi:hypothetical protein
VSSTAAPPAGWTTSQRLHATIGLLLAGLVESSRRIVEHTRAHDVYPEFLFTSHCIIRASVPVMEAARARAADLAAGDEVAAALAAYLGHHIDEERGHDGWLLEDLALVGRPREQVLGRPPSPTVAALVGSQYYWALHYHPVAILGYVALLEGYAPTPELVDELQRRSGWPQAAFRTLRAHAELDPGHREDLDRMLDGLALSPEQASVMGLSAMSTVRLLAQAYDDVLEEAGAAT